MRRREFFGGAVGALLGAIFGPNDVLGTTNAPVTTTVSGRPPEDLDTILRRLAAGRFHSPDYYDGTLLIALSAAFGARFDAAHCRVGAFVTGEQLCERLDLSVHRLERIVTPRICFDIDGPYEFATKQDVSSRSAAEKQDMLFEQTRDLVRGFEHDLTMFLRPMPAAGRPVLFASRPELYLWRKAYMVEVFAYTSVVYELPPSAPV